jgi:hypothetical protein
MLLALGAAGAMGLLLGLRYRVPALLVASGVTTAVCLLVAPFTGLKPLSVMVITFALLGVLQLGYLTGLMLSSAWTLASSLAVPGSPTVDRQDRAHVNARLPQTGGMQRAGPFTWRR